MTTKKRGIEIVGADANNLTSVDARVPRHELTAVVGVSGSGKSSFVEDTIASEAATRLQRFLDIETGASDEDVNAFIGELPPTLFVSQRAFRASSRTTVATSTGLLRVLRRLFVQTSKPVADDVGNEVPDPSPIAFAEWLSRHVTGRAVVWAVPVMHQATTGMDAMKRLIRHGISEAVVWSETDRGVQAEEGRRVPLARFKPLSARIRHSIEARVGDMNISAQSQTTLTPLLEKAWAAGAGGVFVELLNSKRPDLQTAFGFGLDSRRHRVHPDSPLVYAPADEHLLSFNAPDHPASGACPVCHGLGEATGLDEKALIAHPERSMHEGAFVLWTPKNYRYVSIQHETIEGLRGRAGFDPNVPWKRLSADARGLILDGSDDPVEDRDPKTKKRMSAPHPFVGFRRAIIERAVRPSPSGRALRTYVGRDSCHECGGTRWSRQARALRVAGWSIDGLLALPFSELQKEAAHGSLSKRCPVTARSLVGNVSRVAESMVGVGLGHLSGDRGMLDVSDGEARRLRLAGVLSSRLADLLLVLDEPSRGLHEADLDALGNQLRLLTERHTVLMSEHRARLIDRADCVIELGPGAGPKGGEITYCGPPKARPRHRPDRSAQRLASRARLQATSWLVFEGVTIHNVADVTVRIPLGAITCIAGVSGSGKSSFVRGALVPALAARLSADRLNISDFRTRAASWRSTKGLEHVKGLHALDQAPVSAQRRSLITTFVGASDPLRRAFAAEPTARSLGLCAADFGTNAGRGRCSRCLGLGHLDDGAPCPVCGGLRFGGDVLAVQHQGISMAELLDMPVSSLQENGFEPPAPVRPILNGMVELGVGYLALGRRLDTLSGGEIQRLRIARVLARPETRANLFVLDEPAGGLHPTDVERLERALRHIVEDGRNTVVLVEHDPDLLRFCDYIVEFGPGGGPGGGRVVASGTPGSLKPSTPTGGALRARQSRVSRRSAKHKLVQSAPANSLESALQARAEMRQIIGDDVEVSDREGPPVRPAALPSHDAEARRVLEIADLDLAVLRVMLDAKRANVAQEIEQLASTWDRRPELKLQLHPMLDSIATWGLRVPRSVIAEVNSHLPAMGLGPQIPKDIDVVHIRVSGDRLTASDSSKSHRRKLIGDALCLGGGFVELADENGKVQGSLCDRWMELSRGLVAPRRPAASHFRRLASAGACPMCRGSGNLSSLQPTLLLHAQSRPLDDAFLTRQAASILKGVRRSEMDPFFRRLVEEGLWNGTTRYEALSRRDQASVLYGFWVRPGHGSFLKHGRGIDGSEVKHWLRWDGLVAAVEAQLERSSDTRWRDAVLSSKRSVRCPSCEGTGLMPTAALFELGGRGWDDWQRNGTVGGLVGELRELRVLPPRATKERDRVGACLEPLRAAKLPLHQLASAEQRRALFARAASWFAGLTAIED